jgi:hypothetical protein
LALACHRQLALLVRSIIVSRTALSVELGQALAMLAYLMALQSYPLAKVLSVLEQRQRAVLVVSEALPGLIEIKQSPPPSIPIPDQERLRQLMLQPCVLFDPSCLPLEASQARFHLTDDIVDTL